MKALDRLILALAFSRRRSQRRRREQVLQAALPGPEGYYPPGIPAGRHTGERGGLTAATDGQGTLAATRKRLRMAVAAAVTAAVVAGGIGLPAYLVGTSMAAAEAAGYEAATDMHLDAARADCIWTSGQEREAYAATTATYAAEREASGADVLSSERSQELSKMVEMAERLDLDAVSDPVARQWEMNPPESKAAQDALADYREADAAEDVACGAYNAAITRALEDGR